MKAPEFPPGVEWLNTDKALKLSDLRGKVVLLDFWTYCCINCMHIIPDLKRLEKEFPDELVVIGVHSAKFTQEGETANIRQAILRYEIEHPVINDRRFEVWQSYGARAWPTVALIDPHGRLVMTAAGEGVYARFADPVKKLVETFDKAGKIDRRDLGLIKEASTAETSFLAYPGKVHVAVVAYESLPRYSEPVLFVSDQNHNRIVVTDIGGREVREIIGSGKPGFRDGSFDTAEFSHPQGMVLVGSTLYIADTENHAVRAANLVTREVTTLAGNGNQAIGWGVQGGFGSNVPLSSPWDLACRDSILYVAMAGTHQIWTIRLKDGFAEPYAGSTCEGLLDAPRQRASLAQPSGLTILGDRLYFADSEVSAIRYVELESREGNVGTVVGLDLFEFGDRDGVGDSVRLQHPLGITTDGIYLFIADTYNGKIKIINPKTRRVETLFGSGSPGYKDGIGAETQFFEPGGLSYYDRMLYIADTNNGRIRVADLKTNRVSTLLIGEANDLPVGKVKHYQEKKVGRGIGSVRVTIIPPKGFTLNREAPVELSLFNENGPARTSKGKSIEIPGDSASTIVRNIEWLKSGNVELLVDAVFCAENDHNICIPGNYRLVVPIMIAEGSTPDIEITLETEY